MKTNYLLLTLLILGSLISCKKDDDTSITGDGIPGNWDLTAINYTGYSLTEVAGIEIKTDFTGKGKDLNLDISFTENPNNYSQNGSYTIELTSVTNGQETKQDVVNQNFVGNGTWEKIGDKIIIVDNNGDSQESTIAELSSNTLKLDYEVISVTTQQGVSVKYVLDGSYTFTRK